MDKLYKEVDAAATKLCGLKRKLADMSEILENEYKNKYKKSFEKGVFADCDKVYTKD